MSMLYGKNLALIRSQTVNKRSYYSTTCLILLIKGVEGHIYGFGKQSTS